MGKASRDKGARFERSLASKFREYGYDARRTNLYTEWEAGHDLKEKEQ